MNLRDLLYRDITPKPWVSGEKIPWNDPQFSQRMLHEHLNQHHDLASRRISIIEEHVEWINEHIMDRTPGSVLDLGCGPGLYANRLAQLGHTCLGIDFSPASIAYARRTAEEGGLPTIFQEADLRTADYGLGHQLVMMIFGEFSTFRSEDGRKILKKAFHSLIPGGHLLLEVLTCDAVFDLGNSQSSWYCVPSGLFSNRPHLCLQENFWDNESSTATERYLITDLETGEITTYSSSTIAYTPAELNGLLSEIGFNHIQLFPSMPNRDDKEAHKMNILTAVKPNDI